MAHTAQQATSLLSGLNAAQAQAVRTTEGPLLVIAGAGSGKTSVLTRRIAYLVVQQGVPVHQILALTFTNKAAREMAERIKKFIGHAADDLWMGTFHSICVRLLRREAERIGYQPGFTILDSDDQHTLVQQCLLDLNYDLKKVDTYVIQSTISGWKNDLTGPPKGRPKGLNATAAADVFPLYQQRLFRAQAMDFDDLIGNAIRLLETHADVLETYQQKFKYIHVDEYQDTNRAQYQLVRLLAAPEDNICAVGDSDQAIYAWRGADIRNILNFERDYPSARLINMETNYRSTERILKAANELIRNNVQRKPKDLHSARGDGSPVLISALFDGQDEARYVADQIQVHIGAGGSYGDCAVLYRANAQSRAIEEALLGQSIPYTIVGGLTFYDRREIKDAMSYLRVLANPADEIALLRVINTPKRGLGEQALTRLLDFAHGEDITLLAALHRAAETQLADKAAESARQLGETLQELMHWMEGMPVSDFLAEVLHATGYRAMYANSAKKEDLQRLENLDELLSVTQSFDRRRHGTLLEFLAEVSLLSDIDKEKGKPKQTVKLMTLHSSKGLEYPVVFLVGMEEGLFPHARSVDDEAAIEQERNLCYVGMTRAQDVLHMTFCTERTLYGQASFRDPSRFLAELPEDQVTRTMLPDDQYDWKAGDQVRHPQFGQGVVLEVSSKLVNEQPELQLTVMFHPSVGMKTFPKRYARPWTGKS